MESGNYGDLPQNLQSQIETATTNSTHVPPLIPEPLDNPGQDAVGPVDPAGEKEIVTLDRGRRIVLKPAHHLGPLP